MEYVHVKKNIARRGRIAIRITYIMHGISLRDRVNAAAVHCLYCAAVWNGWGKEEMIE
jgi:hypothetical protein